MTLISVIAGLIVLYLWLRGWWFAGLLVCLAYGIGGTQAWGHSWPLAIVIGFSPLLVKHALRAEQENRQRGQSASPKLTVTLLPRDERFS